MHDLQNPYSNLISLPASQRSPSEFDREEVSSALPAKKGSQTQRARGGQVAVLNSRQPPHLGGQPTAFVPRDECDLHDHWPASSGFGAPRVTRQQTIRTHQGPSK